MNICYITHFLPFPPDTGGKKRVFETLKLLTKKHRVFLFTFISNNDELHYIEELLMRLKISKVITIVHPLIDINNWDLQKRNLLKSIFSYKPSQVVRFYNKQMFEKILEILTVTTVDVFWVDSLDMQQYIPKHFMGVKILETQNVESILYFRHARFESNWKWKLFFLLEGFKYLLYELLNYDKFRYIYAISENDKEEIKKILKYKYLLKKSRTVVRILFPVIDQSLFKLHRKHDGKTLLFIGSLKWYPNLHGMLWFLKNVYPNIIKRIPDLRLIIVGELPKRIKLPSLHNVVFIGYVNDITYYLEHSSILVAPIYIGSGIRVKILEAAAAGLPIISTKIASEGIDLQNQQEIILADNKREFLSKVFWLLQNKKNLDKLGANARVKMIDYYKKVSNHNLNALPD